MAKSDDNHQEGKNDAIAHILAKAVTPSGLLGVSGAKIPSEDIAFTYTGVGGQSIPTPCGPPNKKIRRGGRRPWRTTDHPGPSPQLDNGILGIRTAGIKDPANYISHSTTVDDNNNGWEDEKDGELAAALALARAGGFSVDVSLEQTMHKYGAKECDLLRANKVATEIHQEGPSSSGFTNQYDAVVKAAARPEIFEAPDPGVNKIALGGLKISSLWSPPPKSRYNPGRGAWDKR